MQRTSQTVWHPKASLIHFDKLPEKEKQRMKRVCQLLVSKVYTSFNFILYLKLEIKLLKRKKEKE